MTENKEQRSKPNAFWNKIYLLVVVVTIVVITLLGSFSRYFG